MAPVEVPPWVLEAGGVPAENQLPLTSLYVGDLELTVTEEQLFDTFSQVAHVVSVRVCRDITTRRSLGYAYVNFGNPADAARALEVLNFTPLHGKPIRIMYSKRDPSARRSGTANIFIKNLDKAIDHRDLSDTFSVFGNILSCKVATDASGQSKGYGFIHFDQEEAAWNAIEKVNGMLLNGKKVYVGPFLRKQERENAVNKTEFNNVFVKNLSESTTEDDLSKSFGEYGKITSVVVMRDGDGKSKCFGFVNFENPCDAARAVEELHGNTINGKDWYVGRAQKKSERALELEERFEQGTKDVVDKYQGVNLYLKNLDGSIGDEELREMFSDFGIITSLKVIRSPNGVSRGSGFVSFATSEEASRALAEMSGKIIANKPLYVALAERKEDRRARLQAQFPKLHSVAVTPSIAPRVPVYPLGAPGRLFYDQPPPALIPPQPGLGFMQQRVSGSEAAPIPNSSVSVAQQGQHHLRPVGRRTGGPMQQNQQSFPSLQQQMLPRGRVKHYPPGRNMSEVPMPGFVGEMSSVPYDMGCLSGMPGPTPTKALASAMANATPAEQKTMLGESLFPLVEKLEHNMAGKVTGMLLEMDWTEVLHLLELPEVLKAKVTEAREVLRNASNQVQQPTASTTNHTE